MGHGTISNYIEQLRDMDLLDEVGDSIILKAKRFAYRPTQR